MIAHVSPASQAFEESRNTLLYADRAKNIKNKVRCNQFNVSYHIAQYTSIIADLRKEIFRLKMKIEEHEMEDSKKGSNRIAENQEEMVKLRDQLVNTFQEQMDIRRKLMALENETMQITVDTNRYMMVIDEWEQEKMRRLARSRQVARERQRLRSDLISEGEKKTDGQQDESHSGRQKKGSPLERNDDSYSRKTSAKYVKELMNREEKEREKLELGKVENLTKSESFEDIESKDLDTEKDLKFKNKHGKEDLEKYSDDTDSDTFLEPEEVSFARDEINNLIAEEKRTAQQKADLQSKLMQTRKEVEHLEELLPQKISTEDHREILGLLCRIHELEITNAEFQSQALLSDNFLRQKELTISKYDSKQRICDEIIQMQKALINEHDIETPLELQTLYDIYSQQALESDSHTTTAESVELETNEPATNQQKVSVLANLNKKMVASQENDYSFSKLSPLTEESPSRLMSLQNSPVKKTRLSPTSQDLFPSNHRIIDRVPFGLSSPKQRIGNLTPDVLSLNSALPTPVFDTKNDGKNSAESTQQDAADVPIFSKTKKIADIAAKRRIFMDKSVNSSRSSLRPDTDSRTSENGMGSNSDTSLNNGNQNAINAKTAFKSSLSLSDLSMLERKGGDASSEESFGSGRRKIPSKRKISNDGKKGNRTGKTSGKARLRSASLSDSRNIRVKPRMTRKEELQEAARQNRLSTSQSSLKTHDRGNMGSYGKASVVSRRKNQAHSKLHSIQAGDSSNRREKTVPKSRLQVLHGDRPNTRVAQVDRVDSRNVQNSRRIQQTENPEDTSELIHFFSNSTPPSTVHQHGVPFGKGHTIQKRYRRPQDTLGAESSNSTPRIKPRKNVGSLPPKSGNVKNELLINGHAVKPSRHYAGSRRA